MRRQNTATAGKPIVAPPIAFRNPDLVSSVGFRSYVDAYSPWLPRTLPLQSSDHTRVHHTRGHEVEGGVTGSVCVSRSAKLKQKCTMRTDPECLDGGYLIQSAPLLPTPLTVSHSLAPFLSFHHAAFQHLDTHCRCPGPTPPCSAFDLH